ncbi:hypothetical protein JCM8097_007105 [Rhodosporidiobolus ruineniae]
MLSRTASFLTKPRTLVLASTSALAVSYFAATRPTLHLSSAAPQQQHRPMSAKQYPGDKPDSEWQLQLSKEQFRILREKGTEPAGSGEYDKHYPGKGVYECAGCGTPLYTADTKFKSGCGWPAFFAPIPGAITEHVDRSWGMERVEIVCSNCGGHQGHVFRLTPENERHCVNSVSIKYNPNVDLKHGEGGKAKA